MLILMLFWEIICHIVDDYILIFAGSGVTSHSQCQYLMTAEYCCKDKKCCDNMEEEYDHHDMEDGENDDMEEEVY